MALPMKKAKAKVTPKAKDIVEKKVEYHGLCHRCENRVKYIETGHGPRYECQQTTSAVVSCYCYRPVLPVVLRVNDGDDRPVFAGAMISARMSGVKLADDLMLAVRQTTKNKQKLYTPYYVNAKPENHK